MGILFFVTTNFEIVPPSQNICKTKIIKKFSFLVSELVVRSVEQHIAFAWLKQSFLMVNYNMILSLDTISRILNLGIFFTGFCHIFNPNQPGRTDYAQHNTNVPLGFSDLPKYGSVKVSGRLTGAMTPTQ